MLRTSPALALPNPFSFLGWPKASLWRTLVVTLMATWAAGCASLPSNTGRTPSAAFATPDQTALGQLVATRRAQTGARSDSGFRLLDSVEAAFTSRLALIEGAQKTLDLQYYAIHADGTTEILLERLRAAARRGVRVRVLLDDFNTVGADAQVLRLAFEPNIEMRLFNPLPGSRGSLITRVLGSLHDAAAIQKRMHNKLFLADNALGIAGGRNLGDAYFGSDDTSNFVDLDVLAYGRIVRDMSASFDRYWNDELAYPVRSLLSKEDLDRLQKPDQPRQGDPSRTAASEPARTTATIPATAVLPGVTPAPGTTQQPSMDLRTISLTWAPAILMVDKPDKVAPGDDEVDAGDTVVDGLLALMLAAKQDIVVISPYFVPGAQMMKTFSQLRARGIRVRVLTNSLASNDAPAAHAGYARYRKELITLGVELHEMRADQPGSISGLGSTRGASGSSVTGSGVGGSKSGTSRASLHSKAVIIDGRLAVIGSMNLDLRSQVQNSEVALVIRSTALSREAIRLIETTIAKGAYKVELVKGSLRWKAPAGAAFKDETSEPEAGWKLRLLVDVLGPLAPESML